MKLFLALILMTSVSAYALICKEGETLSLYSTEKVLAGSTVTDQGGLNVCGATTLSTVLKSVLRSKDLSHLDIAIQVSKTTPSTSLSLPGNRLAFEGMEDVCNGVKALSNSAGVCLRENFTPEQNVYTSWGGHDPSGLQERFIRPLVTFLTERSQYVSPRTTNTQDMQKLLAYIADKSAKVSVLCAPKGSLPSVQPDFHKSFQSIMGKLQTWISDNATDPTRKSCVKTSTAYFNEFVKTPFTQNLEHPLDIREEVKASFKKNYDIATRFVQWRQGLIYDGSTLSKPFANFLDAHSSSTPKLSSLLNICELSSPESDHPLSSVQLYRPEFTIMVLKELKDGLNAEDCENVKMTEWFASSSAVKGAQAITDNHFGLKELFKSLSVLSSLRELKDILPKLENKTKFEAEDVVSLIAPNCAQNRQKIEPLKCESVQAVVRSMQIEMSLLRQKFQTVVSPALKAGRAVAVGICDEFLKGNYESTVDDCLYHNNGFHYLAVTGQRCVKGKIQYELSNSWGLKCPVQNGTKNQFIECVLDFKGRPTGRYWVQEDLLLNNTMKFHSLSRQ